MTTTPEGCVSKVASEDLAQYAAVTLGGSNDVEECDATGDIVFGVNQTAADHAESGEPANIKVEGVTKVLIDGSTSVSEGDQLMPSGSNAGHLAKHDGAAGSAFVGKVVEIDDGTTTGEEGLVRLYGDRTETT